SRRRHTRFSRDWSSDVCSSDLPGTAAHVAGAYALAELALAVDEERIGVLGAVGLRGAVGPADPVAGDGGGDPFAVGEEEDAVVVGVVVAEVDHAARPLVALGQPIEVAVAAEDAGLQRQQPALVLPARAGKPEREVLGEVVEFPGGAIVRR